MCCTPQLKDVPPHLHQIRQCSWNTICAEDGFYHATQVSQDLANVALMEIPEQTLHPQLRPLEGLPGCKWIKPTLWME